MVQVVVRGIGFYKKPLAVKGRSRQIVNYSRDTGEQGKRRVNEILIRFQLESVGFATLQSVLKDFASFAMAAYSIMAN